MPQRVAFFRIEMWAVEINDVTQSDRRKPAALALGDVPAPISHRNITRRICGSQRRAQALRPAQANFVARATRKQWPLVRQKPCCNALVAREMGSHGSNEQFARIEQQRIGVPIAPVTPLRLPVLSRHMSDEKRG